MVFKKIVLLPKL